MSEEEKNQHNIIDDKQDKDKIKIHYGTLSKNCRSFRKSIESEFINDNSWEYKIKGEGNTENTINSIKHLKSLIKSKQDIENYHKIKDRKMEDESEKAKYYNEWKDTFIEFKSELSDFLNELELVINKYEKRNEINIEGLEPSEENIKEILTLSHKLAYSSFAPYGYEMGDQLGPFKPPNPQEIQFSSSKLYELDEKLKKKEIEEVKKQRIEELKPDENIKEINITVNSNLFEPDINYIKDQETESTSQNSEEKSYTKLEGIEEEIIRSDSEKTREKEESKSKEEIFNFILNPELEQSYETDSTI